MTKESFGICQLIDALQAGGLVSSGEAATLYEDSSFLWQEAHLSWEDVRRMFTFTVEPMNSANLCPTFTTVLNAINNFRMILNADISMHKRRQMYATIIAQARKTVAEQLCIDPSNLALVRNTTEANNILAGGYTRWDGGEVLLWNENHPTNKDAWELRKTGNRSIRYFSFPDPASVTPDEIVKTIANAVTAATRLVSFTEVSNVTGIRIPTREVIAAIRLKEREFGTTVHVHIDGAQSWGSRDLDLTALDCDSFSASSHKWFMGPFETGILFVREGRATDFNISYFGYAGDITVPPWNDLPKNASRFELLGQRDEANLYALLFTADIHNRMAVDESGRTDRARIEKRVASLANELIRELQRLAVRVQFVTPGDAGARHGVVVFRVFNRQGREVPSEYIYESLYRNSDAQFAAAYNALGVRICPHVMNSAQKIVEVARLVERISGNWQETQQEHRKAEAVV